MLTRILKGDPRKRSRFHDFEGNLAPLSAWRYLPRCLSSTARTKLQHRYSGGPWLGYRGTKKIASILRPDWRVLELGAGFSSLWFAPRCRELVSVESDPRWYAILEPQLRGFSNATLLLCEPPFELAPLAAEPFDFALVDGLARDRAMEVALQNVRGGGYVYLDNADVQDPDHCRARRLLLDAANPASVERFVDFSPGHLTVTQGLLAQLR